MGDDTYIHATCDCFPDDQDKFMRARVVRQGRSTLLNGHVVFNILRQKDRGGDKMEP